MIKGLGDGARVGFRGGAGRVIEKDLGGLSCVFAIRCLAAAIHHGDRNTFIIPVKNDCYYRNC